MFHDFQDCKNLGSDSKTANKRIHVSGKGIMLNDPLIVTIRTDHGSHSPKKDRPNLGHLVLAGRQAHALQISPSLSPLQQNLQMTMLSRPRRMVRETDITESA
jgi:hypothetical protein